LMGCEDCPEPTPPSPDTGRYGWVLYTGGPPEIHLAMLRHVVPSDCDRITIRDDGSIEYKKEPGDWEPPRPIDGYKQNDQLFRPLWKSCRWRVYSLEVEPNCRCMDIIAQCNNPFAETVGQLVKCADCDRCSVREEIIFEPPPQRKEI
jgi:hypothetical protein